MLSYVVHRGLHLILTLLGVSVIAFGLVHLSGDPATLLASPDAPQAEVERIREVMGLDRPLPVQFIRYLSRLVQGDLGVSFRTGHDNWDLILMRLPATLYLTATTLVLIIVLGVPAGVFSAIRRGSLLDAAVRGMVIAGQAAPVFWMAIVLILVFSIRFPWFPPSGLDAPEAIILPAFALAFHSAAEVARFARNATLDVLHEDYVRTARAKGLREQIVIGRHVVRNSLIPVITILGLRLGTLMGGAIIVETIFDWPGLGSLAVEAVYNRDVPLVQATMIVAAFFVVGSSLLVDVLYGVADPRIRTR